MALDAGLQLELPNAFGFKHLSKLLQAGRVQEEQINSAVRQMPRSSFG